MCWICSYIFQHDFDRVTNLCHRMNEKFGVVFSDLACRLELPVVKGMHIEKTGINIAKELGGNFYLFCTPQ